ncbi:NADP-dependent malic enzyme [Pseudenhygromyxa sp. WMMC2535]|uniref:NADP-dependent malic enzyme n=1 Tax=Pseudenhygromyxa sp. WMMC2535 TaxID=2712867 RepID=UPI0015574984|nr:NADP-dependent malic enzyme [Pseudenhygromyxa sp. WMMC2535]NVB42758.1 NADP-dependent malic enzyme [Pseudenhygromyxa sp. WMMC2535]
MAKLSRKEALDFHTHGRPGKIAVVPTKPLTSQRDLSLAYSPGVAEPCLEIAKDPSTVSLYTARANLVAVVSDGSAVLGLGNIGPLASKPVMEGKGVLFKKFADIDVFDIEIDTGGDPDKLIECVAALEPTFGGINLEDIKAPECFYIERELERRMGIPVFHDDQHGTAIISGAALINAAALTKRKLEDIKVVVSGAGASAVACSQFYFSLGIRPENLLMCDSRGVIHTEREDLNDSKRAFARETDKRSLTDALDGADMFLGLSVGGLVKPEMLAKMNPDPIIFALANPEPEIPYDVAREARPDAIVATGRSDYDNQVNNVLGFPGIFRGALDVRATHITEEMKRAAAKALAELARKDVPEVVAKAYGEDFTFGRNYIIPKPFDPRVIQWVAPAVAKAAVDCGVAQAPFDESAYRDRMRHLLGGSTAVLRRFVRRAQQDPKRLVFTDGEDPRILEACRVMIDEKICRPILLGHPDRIAAVAAKSDLELDPSGYDIVDPRSDERLEAYAEDLYRLRCRKGVDATLARALMQRSNYFGTMMVERGDADGLVSGIRYSYPETIRPALQIIGMAPGVRRVAGMYLMLHKRGLLFFGDTTVNLETDAELLADVAEMVADAAKKSFDVEPRVAMLGYSNFGSARGETVDKVSTAVELLSARRPDLEVEGEMQANVALDYHLQKLNHPFTRLSGPANVLIFPSLEAGNVAYKLIRELGDVPAVGPVLLGMDKPISVLERDCSIDAIVHMSALTVVSAQMRAEQEQA